ncbi:MAG: YciI family protein [Actinomycetota bacterium]|nr:YciI family protein [Actinomycetota bacterium]
MQYALTIYDDQSKWGEVSPEDAEASGAAYGKVTEEMRAAGAFVAGEGLQPVTTATTVRVPNGERMVTDGPFAETKEQLGGFYVVECKDLDEAIGWAAKLPGAKSGCVEVRPVIQYEG